VGGLLEVRYLGFDALHIEFCETFRQVEPLAYRLDTIHGTTEGFNPLSDLTAPVLSALWAFILQCFKVALDAEPCAGVGIDGQTVER
jgi:hypothetical protein